MHAASHPGGKQYRGENKRRFAERESPGGGGGGGGGRGRGATYNMRTVN